MSEQPNRFQEVCDALDRAKADLVAATERGDVLAANWLKADADLAAERERAGKMREAIRWALGYTDFRPRRDGEGAYWWRKELTERAGGADFLALLDAAGGGPQANSTKGVSDGRTV